MPTTPVDRFRRPNLFVEQTFSRKRLYHAQKPSAIIGFPIVKPKTFRIQIAEKVEWLDTYKRAYDAAFEERPEIFKAARVGFPRT